MLAHYYLVFRVHAYLAIVAVLEATFALHYFSPGISIVYLFYNSQ